MIQFYYDAILGLQFWTFKAPIKQESKKQRKAKR